MAGRQYLQSTEKRNQGKTFNGERGYENQRAGLMESRPENRRQKVGLTGKMDRQVSVYVCTLYQSTLLRLKKNGAKGSLVAEQALAVHYGCIVQPTAACQRAAISQKLQINEPWVGMFTTRVILVMSLWISFLNTIGLDKAKPSIFYHLKQNVTYVCLWETLHSYIIIQECSRTR